ncbi:MAG: hypothetical protein WBM63_09535, partial [Sedimenticolaceae bacterium]
MGLLKKNVQGPPQRGGGGRSLVVYFLPALVIAVVLMLALALYAQQAIRNAAFEAARTTAQSVATAVAARLEGAIVARRDLLALALSDGRAVAALNAGDQDAIRAVEADLRKNLPEVIQVRLLPRDANQPDTSGPAPLGYAGLDMLRRVIETGQTAAEVHQVKTELPYLALALPVGDQGSEVGVL